MTDPYCQPPYPGQQLSCGCGDHPAQPLQRPTSGVAIASLVTAILFGIPGLTSFGTLGFLGVLPVILGGVARRQIRRSGSAGGGLATAGLVIGWVLIGSFLLWVLFVYGVFFVGLARMP